MAMTEQTEEPAPPPPEPLDLSSDPFVTKDGHPGVVMLLSSGRTDTIQWFAYRPSFYGDIIQVEWDVDTMLVVILPEVASYLLDNNYARRMTKSEARAYNKRISGV